MGFWERATSAFLLYARWHNRSNMLYLGVAHYVAPLGTETGESEVGGYAPWNCGGGVHVVLFRSKSDVMV